MDELVYFTNRAMDGGKVRAWVFKELCPRCRKALMGKPTDKKGKVLMRAKEYKCPSCGYTVEKKAYEDTLTANVEYTCPHCKHPGEIQIPFKRKKVQGVDSLRFNCQKCGRPIDITKKMKAIGKKGKEVPEEE